MPRKKSSDTKIEKTKITKKEKQEIERMQNNDLNIEENESNSEFTILQEISENPIIIDTEINAVPLTEIVNPENPIIIDPEINTVPLTENLDIINKNDKVIFDFPVIYNQENQYENFINEIADINILNNNPIINKEQNEYINDLKNQEYILNEDQLINLLSEKDINKKGNFYNLDDLKHIFNQISEAVLLIQIIDGKINFIEKKGKESRNQSVIDLLIKANNFKKLPDIQFIIYTNDIIKNININNYPYLFTFLKNNNNYNNLLFPNFNFNHWLEAKIPSYEYVYNLFTRNKKEWVDKKDIFFWSGSNTNIIRKKIFESSKLYPNFKINLLDKNKNNYIPIDEIINYKFLLNMNGYSYGGRLNYLFLSQSCIIILKNINEDYEEYFYKYFIPNEDFIEVKYNNNEKGEIIINRIITEINKHDCAKIASNCFEKAKSIFKIENIYNYIHDELTNLSKNNIINNKLDNSIFYTPPLHYFYSNRLNNDNISFNFMGKDLEINLIKNNEVMINIKIINDITRIKFDKIILYEKYTPYLLNELKSQHYQILIEDTNFLLILNKKYNVIKLDLPEKNININKNEILSEFGGWWVI
jgi:hypothetical protein